MAGRLGNREADRDDVVECRVGGGDAELAKIIADVEAQGVGADAQRLIEDQGAFRAPVGIGDGGQDQPVATGAGLIGIFVLWSAADLYTGGVRTEGVVLENRESRRTESETVQRGDGREVERTVERVSFAPVVRFTTREGGREIEFHGRGGSDRAFASGERVTVIYDPANPIRARIVSFVDIWLPSAAAFAVAFVFGGAVWLSRRMRQRAKGPRA